jgi:alpha-L-fucosidase
MLASLSLGLVVASLACAAASSNGVRYDPTWASLDSRPLPPWYDAAKVGIFIVGGVFSVPSWGKSSGGASGEWFEEEWLGANGKPGDPAYANFVRERYDPSFTYADFAPMLTMDLFNATQWAELFVDAGAKYTVFLTKHHDGFTLWPSGTSPNWNSVDVGPHIDVTGAVSAAVKAAGLHSGLYHSLFEWYNPTYLADKASNFTEKNFVSKTMGELVDLVTRYEPELIWSDGDWEAPDAYWDAPGNFLAWLVNESPVKDTVVFNDRWGSGDTCKHGSYYTCSDRYNPGKKQNHKWENAMTLDKFSWGYRRNAFIDDYLTFADLMEQLASTVSCGGNLLVNVGPALDGTIPVIMESLLRQMGAWLRVNGAAIYATVPWRAQKDGNGTAWLTAASAAPDADVFAIMLAWPAGGAPLRLAAPIASAAMTATLFTAGGGIACSVTGTPGVAGVSVELPRYESNLAGTGTDVAWAVRLEGVT